MVNRRDTPATAVAAALIGAGVLWIGAAQPAQADTSVAATTVDGKDGFRVTLTGTDIPRGTSGQQRCNKRKVRQEVYDLLDSDGTYAGVGARAAGKLTFARSHFKDRRGEIPAKIDCLFTWKEYPRAC